MNHIRVAAMPIMRADRNSLEQLNPNPYRQATEHFPVLATRPNLSQSRRVAEDCGCLNSASFAPLRLSESI
jgi:hypothetical protein